VFPLELCDVGEDVTVVKRAWQQHFDRCHGREGGPLTVRWVRDWMDEPEPRGLPAELQHLLILTCAALNNRRFTLHGGPATAAIDDRCELVEEPLPAQPHWEEARQRAAKVFGLDLPPLRNASTVGEAVEKLQALAREWRSSAQEAVRALAAPLRQFSVGAATAPHARAAAGMAALVDPLDRAAHRDRGGAWRACTVVDVRRRVRHRCAGCRPACAGRLDGSQRVDPFDWKARRRTCEDRREPPSGLSRGGCAHASQSIRNLGVALPGPVHEHRR